jgi:hypothetical protein
MESKVKLPSSVQRRPLFILIYLIKMIQVIRTSAENLDFVALIEQKLDIKKRWSRTSCLTKQTV